MEAAAGEVSIESASCDWKKEDIGNEPRQQYAHEKTIFVCPCF